MNKLTFLISSSENYHDILTCCINLINKYFKNFVIQIYVVTNGKFKNMRNVKVIKINKTNYMWSDRLMHAINKIGEERLILLTEDLFFKRKIFRFQIKEILDFFEENNANCIYLSPITSIGKKTKNPLFFEIPKWAMHRTSLQLAMWKKNYLKCILTAKETPWEFEINGTKRSRSFKNIFIAKKIFLIIQRLLVKEKLHPKVSKL